MSLTISRTISVTPKIGLNHPCYCDSGKKYKKCHYLEQTPYTPELKTKLLTKVSSFLIKQKFFAELTNQITLDIFTRDSSRRQADGRYEIEEDELGSIIDAVMFEGEYQGKSPLAWFVKHADLSPTERQMYQGWANKTRYSIFEVKKVTIGKSFNLVDIITNESFLVYEKLATYEAEQGATITGRIVPFANAWMFTGGTNIRLTPEMLYNFKRTAKNIKPGELKQLDIIKFFQFNTNTDNPLVKFEKHGEKEPGPREKTIIQTMLQEGQQAIIQTKGFDALPQKKKEKKLETFTKNWLRTPQKDLGDKTPNEIIAEERNQLGLPPPEYRHSITKMSAEDDELCEQYDEAVDKMRDGDFLEALELFLATYSHHIQKHDETFRWWVNAGACLANLGEEALAKRYYEKSLAINSEYEVAQKNIEAFKKYGDDTYLHAIGRQKLFTTLLRRGITFSKKGLEKNPFLHDAIAFLAFFATNTITPTKALRDIPVATAKAINRQFVTPDSESLTLRIQNKLIQDPKREEDQFPKVKFLHSLFLAEKMIQDDRTQLHITKHGSTFLQLPPEEQWSKLLAFWLADSDWVALERPKNDMDFARLNEEVIQEMQNTTWQMLDNLQTYAGKDIDYSLTVKGLTKELPSNKEIVTFLSSLILDRVFIDYLIWTGIVTSKSTGYKNTVDLRASPPTVFPIRLTPFGKTIIQTLNQAMHDAIPQLARTLV